MTMEGSKIVVSEEINNEISTTDGRPPNPFAPVSRNCFSAAYKKSLVRHPSLLLYGNSHALRKELMEFARLERTGV